MLFILIFPKELTINNCYDSIYNHVKNQSDNQYVAKCLHANKPWVFPNTLSLGFSSRLSVISIDYKDIMNLSIMPKPVKLYAIFTGHRT